MNLEASGKDWEEGLFLLFSDPANKYIDKRDIMFYVAEERQNRTLMLMCRLPLACHNLSLFLFLINIYPFQGKKMLLYIKVVIAIYEMNRRI